MDKDFTHWHAVKQQLNQQPPRTFEEREVWWASVGANVDLNRTASTRNLLARC